MKRISVDMYNTSMGTLIDLENNIKYNEYHIDGAINIPYDKLILNHSELLDKNKKYFLYCRGGYKSKKAVSILEFYGYDVTQVIS